MTKSTRRRVKCMTCGHEYSAKTGPCPSCSEGPAKMSRTKSGTLFPNYGGGGSKRGGIADKLLDAFEKGKGK